MWVEIGEFIKLITPMITTIATAATAVTALVGAIVAVIGLRRWRQELLGRRKVELAEEVLAGFYQMRDLMDSVRSPMTFVGEGETRQATEVETAEVKKLRDRDFAALERYTRHSDFFASLHAKRYRMKAYFGPQVDEAYRSVDRSVTDVITAAKALVSTVPERMRDEEVVGAERWQEAVWKMKPDSEDAITIRINEGVQLMERICRPILEGRK